MLSSRGIITRLTGTNGSRVKQPVNHLDNGCNLPDNQQLNVVRLVEPAIGL